MATIESGARFWDLPGIPSEFSVYLDMCACHFSSPMDSRKTERRSVHGSFHIANGTFYIHVAFCFKSVEFLYHLFAGFR